MLHLFLCLVSQPVLLAPIDADESMNGVLEVIDAGRAVVATINGEIVGSIGLVRERWWYSADTYFWADRWAFCYPAVRNTGVGAMLLAEAGAMSAKAGEDLVITGKLKRRNLGVGRGVVFSAPLVVEPSAVDTVDWGKAARQVLH